MKGDPERGQEDRCYTGEGGLRVEVLVPTARRDFTQEKGKERSWELSWMDKRATKDERWAEPNLSVCWSAR